LRFVPDEYGVAYHSKPNTWQRKFGYNIFYDEIFDIGSEMNVDFIPFSTDDEDYVLWMWKGDYWNLGSGAEIGLYCNPENIVGSVDFEGKFHIKHMMSTLLVSNCVQQIK